MMSSATTARLAEASSDVHVDTSPPMEQTNLNYFPDGEDWREPKSYKARFWALDTLWNRLKPSKRKEISLASELCEADIRVPKYDFSKLAAATNLFSHSNKIGEGGSARVYKAVLPTGRTVAVKRYSSSQDRFTWFKNEILSVSSLHQRNIIKLLGYCIYDKTGMLLYEFMENGSLDRYIRGEERRRTFQWSGRFKVIIGIAKGVIYLHQESSPKIIHRDLNPTNILLDNEMNPKLSGFGLAIIIEDDQPPWTTGIAGTWGYISPEFFLGGLYSEKSDVYSFGMLVMEILSGKRNNRGIENPVCNAWELWRENGNVLTIVDEYLGGEFSEEEALRCIQVCLLCTQDEPQQRPTMASALRMLLGEDLSLQEKMEQAQFPENWSDDVSFNQEIAAVNPRQQLDVFSSGGSPVAARGGGRRRTLRQRVDWRHSAKRIIPATDKGLKPSKRKEISLASELCEEDIRVPKYDFSKLAAATNLFSHSNKIGGDGFWSVYKGVFSNGQEIAVRRLASSSHQGNAECVNELSILARLQHRNLVKLLGFCQEGNERLVIYEFVENSSLDRFIFDPIKPPFLDWDQRYKIILGTAMGLHYLHEDFNFARVLEADESPNTSMICGTLGYMAPEYAMHGTFSVKSDVFSFGVLVLEILTCQRNKNFVNKKDHRNDVSIRYGKIGVKEQLQI
ncbi:non-specific serine/threonine protein kinase [Salvia divinorum]|uniref:Non-specific serine/threonine protein kinase n=1 Tax=Salvia divinorum TaxID=28513 RepID=A0ABD1G3Y4_SALDI